MVANKSSVYNWVPAFRATLDSTLQFTAVHKTQIDTSCLL